MPAIAAASPTSPRYFFELHAGLDAGGHGGRGRGGRLVHPVAGALHRGEGVVHDRLDGAGLVAEAPQLRLGVLDAGQATEALGEGVAEACDGGGATDDRAALEDAAEGVGDAAGGRADPGHDTGDEAARGSVARPAGLGGGSAAQGAQGAGGQLLALLRDGIGERPARLLAGLAGRGRRGGEGLADRGVQALGDRPDQHAHGADDDPATEHTDHPRPWSCPAPWAGTSRTGPMGPRRGGGQSSPGRASSMPSIARIASPSARAWSSSTCGSAVSGTG